MILKCNCTHAFQDREHGKLNRVHTPKKVTREGIPRFTCTVCGTERTK